MSEDQQMSVVFVKEYRNFIAVYEKKAKDDYVLNVSKILKDKFKSKFLIPNKVQSFILNYEIKKLLDKVILLKNKKYRRIVYLNSNISTSIVLNTITFIEDEYSNLLFNYSIIEPKGTESLDSIELENVTKIKLQ